MAVEDKDKKSLHPETNFLPPLKMVLSFSDKEVRQKKKKKGVKQANADEKNVEKLIEKLSEDEEEPKK